MRNFGTLFNINYLNRGLALLESLRRNEAPFNLYVLCLDDQTHEYLLQNEVSGVTPIKLQEIEQYFPELLKARSNRSLVEYFFTLSPALPLYILEKYGISQITTLDADIYIYDSLDPVFDEMGSDSILISPHKFSGELRYKEIYGLYNVSFQSFKNDDIGLSCLKDWLKNCVEWCYDELRDGKFADQLYLNSWVEKYQNVCVIQHPGAAVAPWNLSDYSLSMNGKKLYIEDKPLLFYHFHGVKFITKHIALHNLDDYNFSIIDELIIRELYGPYIQKLSNYNSYAPFTHSNIRNNYSRIWILKKILKGGALKIDKHNVRLMNSHFYKFFNWLSSTFRKRT